MQVQVKDIILRAVKTFVQAFLGALMLSSANVVDLSTAKQALIAACAMGFSAVMNLIRDTYKL